MFAAAYLKQTRVFTEKPLTFKVASVTLFTSACFDFFFQCYVLSLVLYNM